MPKLLSRSKHEEFESNSASQIRNKKQRRAENAWKLEPAGNLVGLRNFRNLRIFVGCEITPFHFSQLLHIGQISSTVPAAF